MKDGRLSGSFEIIYPILFIFALTLPLLFLFVLPVVAIFEIVLVSRAAPPGPVSVLSFCQGRLPSRSPPLSA